MNRYNEEKDYFWAQHEERLQKIDDEASEPRIEILPTFTDENGVVWQLPHQDANGWARLCFDACMSGSIMTATRQRNTAYKVGAGGRFIPCDWVDEHITIAITTDGRWRLEMDGQVLFYPSAYTYRVFLKAVGFNWDFSEVVLC